MGVITIIVCIAVAVFFTDLSTARGWGVFSAGRIWRHPPLLVFTHTSLKQARVAWVRWFHRRWFEPRLLLHYAHSVFGLVLQQGRLKRVQEWRRVQPGVPRGCRRWGGGRGGWYGSKPPKSGAGFSGVTEVLWGGPAGAPTCWGGSWYRHACRRKRMIWIVAESMVSRCLQGEGLVETISREVPLIGGSEVKPIWGHALLRWQVPAAVGTGGCGWVFVLLAHTNVVAAIEAALGQGAHVLFREVALGVAAPWQQLLALCRGGGEAIRVGRSVQPRQEGGGGGEEKRVWEEEEKKKVLFPAQTSNNYQTSHSPSHPFTAACSAAASNCIFSNIKRLTRALRTFKCQQWPSLIINAERTQGSHWEQKRTCFL